MGKQRLNILYEDNHILVAEKPANIPVQQDDTQDTDFLTILKHYIKEKYQKPGNVYLGLVHRLDRPVGGIMVFAKTSKAASRLSEQIRTQKIEKTYLAVVEGKIESAEDTWIDKLKKDPKTNSTRIDESGKIAILDYQVIATKNNLSLVKINLKTGRSHQIRVQFSSRNHPLYGDQRYHPNPKKDQIALFANALAFYHPTKNEYLHFELPKPKRYPFTIF